MKSTYFREEHGIFRDTVRAFVERDILPYAEDWEKEEQIPRHVWSAMASHGMLGLNFSPTVGGAGADFFYSVVLLEELSRGTPIGFSAAVSVHQYTALAYLDKYGTAYQKMSYLSPGIGGAKIGAVAITEKESGSDVANIRTRAELDGDEYVLNGSKTFITNGVYGNFAIVAAKTDPAAGASGISLLIVDLDSEGVSRRKLKKLGWHCSDTAELAFDDVRVPKANLLGEMNMGFYYLMEGFQLERLVTAVVTIAAAEACMNATYDHILEREVFDRPLARFQTIRHNLIDLATELEAAKQLVYQGCWLYSQGESDSRIFTMAKLHSTELAQRIVHKCQQYFGGSGLMDHVLISRLYRDIRVLTIAAGTSEVMRDILSRLVIDGHEERMRGGKPLPGLPPPSPSARQNIQLEHEAKPAQPKTRIPLDFLHDGSESNGSNPEQPSAVSGRRSASDFQPIIPEGIESGSVDVPNAEKSASTVGESATPVSTEPVDAPEAIDMGNATNDNVDSIKEVVTDSDVVPDSDVVNVQETEPASGIEEVSEEAELPGQPTPVAEEENLTGQDSAPTDLPEQRSEQETEPESEAEESEEQLEKDSDNSSDELSVESEQNPFDDLVVSDTDQTRDEGGPDLVEPEQPRVEMRSRNPITPPKSEEHPDFERFFPPEDDEEDESDILSILEALDERDERLRLNDSASNPGLDPLPTDEEHAKSDANGSVSATRDEQEENGSPAIKRSPLEADFDFESLDLFEDTAGPETGSPVAAPNPGYAAVSSVRKSFETLPERFLPKKAGEFQTIIHFVVSGRETGNYTVHIRRGKCRVTSGLNGDARCVVKSNDKILLDIEKGRVNPQVAFMMGKLSISNVPELMRYLKYFRKLG